MSQNVTNSENTVMDARMVMAAELLANPDFSGTKSDIAEKAGVDTTHPLSMAAESRLCRTGEQSGFSICRCRACNGLESFMPQNTGRRYAGNPALF